MHKLNQHTRPPQFFDAGNVEHRAYFNEFMQTTSWKNCPFQWFITDDSADVVHFIQNSLVSYYLNQEFVAKKQRKSPKKVTI